MTTTDKHDVIQGEGGEQGDPLMPAISSISQHMALEDINAKLQPDEHLCVS